MENSTVYFKNGILDPVNKVFTPCRVEGPTLNCNYNPTAKNIAFYNMLCTYLPDEKYRNMFLEYVGTCLVRNLHTQKLLFCVGESATGKSTVCTLLIELFGDLAKATSISLLKLRGGCIPRHKNVIIDFDFVPGKRTLEVLRELPFKFIGCLNSISFLEGNIAISRRIIIIPFLVTNTHIFWQDVCKTEDGFDGIVNYFLEGLYQFKGDI